MFRPGKSSNNVSPCGRAPVDEFTKPKRMSTSWWDAEGKFTKKLASLWEEKEESKEMRLAAPLYQPRKSSNYISPQGGERMDYHE